MKIKSFFVNNWPIVAIFLLVATLFATNYKAGTWLTGWDNLHPEFDFGTNIRRSVFAVWQEYQGLGLLGGMGHAAALVRELILYAILLDFFDAFYWRNRGVLFNKKCHPGAKR